MENVILDSWYDMTNEADRTARDLKDYLDQFDDKALIVIMALEPSGDDT
jgi:hypothetical protein